MAISVEATSTRIIVTISNQSTSTAENYLLQRASSTNRTWLTLTSTGFADLSENTELTALEVSAGDIVDSYDLTNDLYEYRYVSSSIDNPSGTDYVYSKWVKFGTTSKIGYSFNNYSAPSGKWGSAVTPDDERYTYLWGTDFKATNGSYFTDEQIQWFIDESTKYLERELNITIKKIIIKSTDTIDNENLTQSTKYKDGDYDEEESVYDFSYRHIQRYGEIQTKHRPILKINKCELLERGGKRINLMQQYTIDRKQGAIKFYNRPFKKSRSFTGIENAMLPYGSDTINSHLYYVIDYTAGYENSDYLPEDLRQIIGKIAAISLLNIIGDGLMSGFSSSSLSMDGISESFSSTQSATSAYFGARIQVYKDDVKNYIAENKHKFGHLPIGAI